MHFKIEKTGCSERKGLVQVRFDLFLDDNDVGYKDHLVETEIDGKKETVVNPFCCHFCQFEPGVTDEEILYVGELALDMAGKNYHDLKKNKNLPVYFTEDNTKRATAAMRVKNIMKTDFANLKTIGNYRVK
jgi:hypothetical protein